MSIIRLFDKTGAPIRYGDIDAKVDRSWILNGIGSATFSIAKTDPVFREYFIQYGNRVLIQEDDMGQWGGIVLPPRPWSADSVELTVYTIEELLKSRNPGATSYSGYAGDIFEDLIASANTNEDTLIDTSYLYAAGESWTEDTSSGSVYDAISSIAKRTGQDWEIEPIISATGKLNWIANWHEERGEDLSGEIVLEEGTHFEIPRGALLNEQGPIYNSIKLLAFDGNGGTTTATAEDATSQDLYGLLEGSFSESIPETYTAQTYCDHLLEIHKYPRLTFRVSIINDDVDTLKHIRLGNTVTLHLVTYCFTNEILGAEKNVRITSIEADEYDSTLSLVVTEVV